MSEISCGTGVLLTIGGSDSGGGAGIQADIKTFSVLGWHGTCAFTAVTAQNTLGVQRIFGLKAEAVKAQLESITGDFHVVHAKTGMLYSAEIVMVAAEHLRRKGIPFVLDPVIEAEAGGRLLRPEAARALKEDLIPLARVVTPNIFEARALTGVPVSDAASAELAARKILDLGAGAVVVKGGHLDCTDVLADEAGVCRLSGKRVKGGNHGVGCTYSASLTSFLGRGLSLRDSASRAKAFASAAILHSSPVGRGAGPVNQAAVLREEARRFRDICAAEKKRGEISNTENTLDLLLDDDPEPRAC
jgi:hydroxymethylpyrimidine kinase/phosphomethylpyrimidine kinase